MSLVISNADTLDAWRRERGMQPGELLQAHHVEWLSAYLFDRLTDADLADSGRAKRDELRAARRRTTQWFLSAAEQSALAGLAAHEATLRDLTAKLDLMGGVGGVGRALAMMDDLDRKLGCSLAELGAQHAELCDAVAKVESVGSIAAAALDTSASVGRIAAVACEAASVHACLADVGMTFEELQTLPDVAGPLDSMAELIEALKAKGNPLVVQDRAWFSDLLPDQGTWLLQAAQAEARYASRYEVDQSLADLDLWCALGPTRAPRLGAARFQGSRRSAACSTGPPGDGDGEPSPPATCAWWAAHNKQRSDSIRRGGLPPAPNGGGACRRVADHQNDESPRGANLARIQRCAGRPTRRELDAERFARLSDPPQVGTRATEAALDGGWSDARARV